MKNFLLLFLFSIFTLSPKTSSAVTFYSGLGLGESKSKFEKTHFDDKRAFTFSFGSSFSIPLFPIRLETEYLKYNSQKDI